MATETCSRRYWGREQIDIEPGGWLYKDPEGKDGNKRPVVVYRVLASMNIITNRFTGPGRIALQSITCIFRQEYRKSLIHLKDRIEVLMRWRQVISNYKQK